MTRFPLLAPNCKKSPAVLPSNRFPAPSTKNPLPLSKVVGGDAPSAILPLLTLLIARVDAFKLNVSEFISNPVPSNFK